MKTIYKDVTNKKGKTYNVKLIYDEEDRELIDFSCYCRFMSFDFWSKKFQQLGTICRHILQACAEENITLPQKYQTDRNLKIIETFNNQRIDIK